MKKAVIPTILAVALVATTGVCIISDYKKDDNTSSGYAIDMSEPFEKNNDLEIGGDELSCYFDSYSFELTFIPMELIDYVGANEFDNWCLSYKDNETTLPTGTVNMYSFIKKFDIPQNVVEKYVIDSNSVCDKLDCERIYSADFVDILYSDDTVKISQRFASDYSIVVGENVYPLKWIYSHNIEEYRNENITSEMLCEKAELYKTIPFTNEAQNVLSKKIELYCE